MKITRTIRQLLPFAVGASLLAVAASASASASASGGDLPRIVTDNGRHSFIVDGKPFLILGAQIHNSSNYPAALPSVWPVIHALHANTVEAPVAWEQLEPIEGSFDFTWVDTLLAQARTNHVRLVLLWFGSWKNGESTYAPEWVKADTRRFPRLQHPDHRPTMTLSPFGDATLAADTKAFVALMRHLREVDARNTVIMVQVENEIGTHQSPRDYSPVADQLFAGAVPQGLQIATGKAAGTWSELFGKEAEQSFAAWSYAKYVNAIAAAGKVEKRLPMYTNAAVFDAATTALADKIASGGPNWNVLPIWKAVAPNLDLIGVDLYSRDAKTYIGLLDRYNRPDNALFVPESSNAPDAARYFWAALGRGAIGWSPFGMDATDYNNYPLGARAVDAATLEAFAMPFQLFRPIAADWAAIAASHATWGTVKGDAANQTTVLGRWRITALYGHNNFDFPGMVTQDGPPWAGQMVGGAVVAQLGADEFLIAGQYARLQFSAADPADNMQIMSAEEGTFVNGQWQASRLWNGDQITSGFNFNKQPALLKVKLATFGN